MMFVANDVLVVAASSCFPWRMAGELVLPVEDKDKDYFDEIQ